MTTQDAISKVNQFFEELIADGEPKNDCLDARDALIDIIVNGTNPDGIFTLLATGAYKECYDFGLAGYIVKFYSKENDTDGEQYILSQAAQYGVAELFLPSFYCELPNPIEAYILDGEENYEFDDDNEEHYEDVEIIPNQLVGFIIQPKVVPCNDRTLLYWEREDVTKYYPEDHLTPDEYFQRFDAQTGDWVYAIYQSLGNEYLWALISFIDDLGINDLHAGNVGWLGNKPVILDWLSVAHG